MNTKPKEDRRPPDPGGLTPRVQTARSWLFRPSGKLKDPGDVRQASLTIALTLFFSLLISVGAIMTNNPTGQILMPVLALISIASYLLSHTRHFRISSALLLSAWTALSLFEIIWGQADSGRSRALLVFMPLTFLLGTALLNFRFLTILVLVNLAGAVSLPLLYPDIESDFVSSFGILLTLGGLTLIIQHHREEVERRRLQALKDANRDLKTAIGDLEIKNAELERFTYTISHDLRSPLVTITGYLGYLEKDAASRNLERFQLDRQRIQEAVLRMESLLEDLLELTRAGRMVMQPESIPFEQLVTDAVSSLDGLIKEHPLRIIVQPDLPAVWGDQKRLTEVLQNLIENAIKFSQGQAEPLVEIGQQVGQDGKPVFFVRDNGIGIPREQYQRVFGLFEKLDPHSSGTGVGLAIVKQIVESHGGRIWVDSAPGQGSTFYFTLELGAAGSS